VLHKYFQFQTEFTSFRRQLNIYGFRRVKGKGPDQHAYYHCLFLRGRPDLCELILRNKRASQKTNQFREPDFVAMVSIPNYAPSERSPVKSVDKMMTNGALGSEDCWGPTEAMLFHLCEAAAICAPSNAALEQDVQCCNRPDNVEAAIYDGVDSAPNGVAAPWSYPLQSKLMPIEWRTSTPEPWYSRACSENELMHGCHPARPSRSSMINSTGQTETSHPLEDAILQLGPEDVSQLQIRTDHPIADLLDMTQSSGSEMADWLNDIDLE
jgi:HSF-type DNA-binding